MDKKFFDLYMKRVERFIDRLGNRIVGKSIQFDAEYAWTEEPVPFNKRLDLEYKTIKEGDSWGKTWESAWFHLKARIPEEWKGENIVANLDFEGEGLIFDNNGKAVQGITNGSVFKQDFARDIVRVKYVCSGGEDIEFWVETAANGLFGMFLEQDPLPDAPDRYGYYNASVKKIRLAVFNEKLWHLWLDLWTLKGLLQRLPEKSVRRARVLRCCNEAIDAFADNDKNVVQARYILENELKKPASASDLSVLAVGHAHIDTAWLWPVRETIRKCGRTFASQVNLIDQYPKYVFGASQPQHYQFVKDYYPELYERVKAKIADGSWEVQGGMWVEADCNLISGESMVRQILHGKNFFKDEFGIDVKNLWLPDVFGYSAALPQILKKSGIDYFLTQKISWNQFNDFPHTTFIWRGMDGSEVLTHFPPENTYNSMLSTEYLIPGMENFREKDYIDEFISLFGVGDGGGGPKEENIEYGKRMADLEGSPRVRFGTAQEFFEGLEEYSDKLPRWVGELYLELHRGTLTTQAKTKLGNRKLENRVRLLEILYSAGDLKNYPAEEIDKIWKKILINQFHDIIPGSSINKAYKVTESEHAEALEKCEKLITDSAKYIFEEDKNSMVLFNSACFPFEGIIELPESWKGHEVIERSITYLPVQQTEGSLLCEIIVNAFSFKILKKGDKVDREIQNVPYENLVLENDIICYKFKPDGTLISAYDKILKKEFIKEGQAGNLITLYDDHPNDWDAWDVDVFYENNIIENARGIKAQKVLSGDLMSALEFELEVGNSKIDQKVTLEKNQRELRFYTTVDWQEKHRMMRVAFPVDVRADEATFDIQYGYVKRPTHRNTSWDQAKFEVPAHRYVDLSEREFGVALLNNGKYGHKVLDNTIDLNLLRAPTYPDPDADQGKQEFTYALLPHEGELINSNVMQRACLLNRGLEIFDGYSSKMSILPWYLSGDGITMEVVKKAEKEDCLIIRIVEVRGKNSSGILYLKNTANKIIQTDLMEWENGEVYENVNMVRFSLKPFEIRTYKLLENSLED